MPILNDLALQIVNKLNNRNDHKDWDYAFYEADQRHWAAIYRQGWLNRSMGVRLQRAWNQGVKKKGHRTVIWFEIAHDIGNNTSTLNYYLRFDSDNHLSNYLRTFYAALRRIIRVLHGNHAPLAVAIHTNAVARNNTTMCIDTFTTRINNLTPPNLATISTLVSTFIADRYIYIDGSL